MKIELLMMPNTIIVTTNDVKPYEVENHRYRSFDYKDEKDLKDYIERKICQYQKKLEKECQKAKRGLG